MGQISFLGPTYQSRSPNLAADRSINLYPELAPGDAKNVIALIGTPGTSLFSTPGATPVREIHVFNGTMYAIVGDGLYEISSGGTPSAKLGTLTTSSGPVVMENNGIKSLGIGGDQLIIVDGTNGYIFNTLTSVFSQLVGIAGTHKTGYPASAFYIDANGRDLIALGMSVGMTVYNETDGSSGVITAIQNGDSVNDKIVATLSGGSTNLWAIGQMMSIMGGGFPVNPSYVTYLDGYFVVINNTMSAWASDLYNGLRWNALSMASITAVNDPIKAVVSLHQQLWFIKEYSAEVWYDAGIATSVGFPFLRVSGAVIGYGTPAPKSVAFGANTLFFLASEMDGNHGEFVGIVQLNGYVPTVISTAAINYRISQLSSGIFGHNDAFGYCYSEGGHSFYVITFPTGDATLVYDITTQLWHERSTSSVTSTATLYLDDSISVLSSRRTPNALQIAFYDVHRHLGNCYAFFNNKHYVGHYLTGSIYEMSSVYFRDGVIPIVSIRVAQHTFDRTDLKSIVIHRLQIDSETGIITESASLIPGIGYLADGTYFADGTIYAGADEIPYSVSDPQIILSWSDDGGHTWSNDNTTSFGMTQQYKKRVIWRRLGVTRDRVFRLAISDAVKRTIIGAYAEITG